MIALPAGTQIWIAAGVTDLRRGFMGLSAIAQTVLKQNLHSGLVFVFRGRRGDLILNDGVPIRTPLGRNGGLVSNGSVLRLTVMPARSRACSA